jgi:hypothetical protein
VTDKKAAKTSKKTYTEPEDGARPATIKPFTPDVKPSLGKGKGPVQPKNVARPKKKTRPSKKPKR